VAAGSIPASGAPSLLCGTLDHELLLDQAVKAIAERLQNIMQPVFTSISSHV
jgi:hypothetical protein